MLAIYQYIRAAQEDLITYSHNVHLSKADLLAEDYSFDTNNSNYPQNLDPKNARILIEKTDASLFYSPVATNSTENNALPITLFTTGGAVLSFLGSRAALYVGGRVMPGGGAMPFIVLDALTVVVTAIGATIGAALSAPYYYYSGGLKEESSNADISTSVNFQEAVINSVKITPLPDLSFYSTNINTYVTFDELLSGVRTIHTHVQGMKDQDINSLHKNSDSSGWNLIKGFSSDITEIMQPEALDKHASIIEFLNGFDACQKTEKSIPYEVTAQIAAEFPQIVRDVKYFTGFDLNNYVSEDVSNFISKVGILMGTLQERSQADHIATVFSGDGFKSYNWFRGVLGGRQLQVNTDTDTLFIKTTLAAVPFLEYVPGVNYLSPVLTPLANFGMIAFMGKEYLITKIALKSVDWGLSKAMEWGYISPHNPLKPFIETVDAAINLCMSSTSALQWIKGFHLARTSIETSVNFGKWCHEGDQNVNSGFQDSSIPIEIMGASFENDSNEE